MITTATVSFDQAHVEALMSESDKAAPKGASRFDKPLGLLVRRHCALMLDLEPFCSGEEYVRRRNELGAEEVIQRLLWACSLDSLVVDTGHRSDSIADVPMMPI